MSTATPPAATRSPSFRAPPPSDEPVVAVRGLSKCYPMYKRPQDRLWQALSFGRRRYFEEFWALRDVSFEVRRGETVGIVGRNGSGKSTLLQIVCGTLRPTVGEAQARGRIAALLELGSGFNPEFTGRENIFLNSAIFGVPPEETRSKLERIIAFADIGQHLDQPVKTYSSGMFVRLAFAVVAHLDADVLIVDEALSVGDAFFSQKCMRFLRAFRERGTTLFVSHNTGAVINLCQRAVWLEKGRVRQTGAAKEVCEAYLAANYEAAQGPHAVASRGSPVNVAQSKHYVDQRQQYVNASNLRNDLQVIPFSPESGAFGKGGATILDVELQDAAGNPLHWIVGGEIVRLCIKARAKHDLLHPLLGFFVKDRLGQSLFGDNTQLTYADRPVEVAAGDAFQATFEFPMPRLPQGDYSICAAVAEGTQHEHVQHHWLHDALIFRSHSSSLCTGLIGVPMLKIEMNQCSS